MRIAADSDARRQVFLGQCGAGGRLPALASVPTRGAACVRRGDRHPARGLRPQPAECEHLRAQLNRVEDEASELGAIRWDEIARLRELEEEQQRLLAELDSYGCERA